MKYYAVKVGARTGVFTSWEECQKAVDGFSGATIMIASQSKKILWTDI